MLELLDMSSVCGVTPSTGTRPFSTVYDAIICVQVRVNCRDSYFFRLNDKGLYGICVSKEGTELSLTKVLRVP